MEDLATSINTSSAALNLGEGVTGVLVKEEIEDLRELSFAYESPNESIWVSAELKFKLHTQKNIDIPII